MSNYIYIGKIVNTHGIKGEIRLLSNFDKKEIVFKKDFSIYIGATKEHFVINSYRKHKNFDMITLKGIDDINDVLKYKGEKVYVLRSSLNLNDKEYVLDDLLNMKVMSNGQEMGIIKDIFDNNGNVLLQIDFDKNYYIPYNERYIKNVDLENNIIEVLNVEDLIL